MKDQEKIDQEAKNTALKQALFRTASFLENFEIKENSETKRTQENRNQEAEKIETIILGPQKIEIEMNKKNFEGYEKSFECLGKLVEFYSPKKDLNQSQIGQSEKESIKATISFLRENHCHLFEENEKKFIYLSFCSSSGTKFF